MSRAIARQGNTHRLTTANNTANTFLKTYSFCFCALSTNPKIEKPMAKKMAKKDIYLSATSTLPA
jgi:hypothetical protein